MNRLGIFLVGAALTIGGSALASAQALPQNVAYHDRDHDRDRDRDRDRKRERERFEREREHDRRSNHDYDRRFVRGERRWDGHRWQHWDGFRWVY